MTTQFVHMTTITARHWLADISLLPDNAFGRFIQRLRIAMRNFNARWEARARESLAIRELRSLSDRELHDLGIDRSEISRVARAGAAR